MTKNLDRPWLARLKALKSESPEKGTDRTDESHESHPFVSSVSASLADAENVTASPANWRRAYAGRVRRRMGSTGYARAEAERLAWGEILNEWHLAHYVPPSPDNLCAGCHKPVGSPETLSLPDGSRVHFNDLACLTSYGHHWRAVAAGGLQALGINPPDGWEA